MSYRTASADTIESVIPEDRGAMLFFRDALDTDALGFTVLRLAPGASGKEHDHETDAIEEVYYVVDGAATVTVDGDAVELVPGDAIHIPADTTRQITAGPDGAHMILASAPQG